MTDLNKLDSVFEKIEAPDIKLLSEIGKRIGFGRACQILGEQWDDMLEKEWGLPRGRGKMERRNDIEAIEAAIAARAASQTCVAKPELPPVPDGSMACEYVHDAIVFDDADMREYGQSCLRAALSAYGQRAEMAVPVAAMEELDVFGVSDADAVKIAEAESVNKAFLAFTNHMSMETTLQLIQAIAKQISVNSAPSQPQQEAVQAAPQPSQVAVRGVLMPEELTEEMRAVLKEVAPKWNAESIYANLKDAASQPKPE